MPRNTNIHSHTVAKAIQIACTVHSGQVDKGGDPYLFHTFRVGSSLWPSITETAVGMLHDTIEDAESPSEVYGRIVADLGIEIATKVLHLTRKRGQDYERYIEEISHDDVCRRVKIADLKDNLNPERVVKAYRNGVSMARLLERYEKALTVLKAVEG